MDILFVIPSNDRVYQELKTTYSSIEPPTWGLLLAESCRSVGHEVGILDMNAENQSHEQGLQRIKELNPKWLCFVVYGQNVNAGTVSMYGATQLSKYLKSSDCKIPNIFVGSYMQALPIKALQDEPSIDIVLTNEGVYALWALAGIQATTDPSTLGQINGIGFRKDGKPFLTAPGKIVPQERMDIDLPGYAWDLLPKKEKPFDLYRAPMWHANYDANLRTPYATLFSSFGCKFGCNFCMINIINRNDNDPIGVASNYKGMRYWSPEFILKQFDKLHEMGVSTIRLCDEMFLLNSKYYVPICEGLAKKEYSKDLLLWAYSRIDTVSKDPGVLKLLRKAGFRWLCLGIESGSQKIRLEISKGKFLDVDIRDVVKKIEEADIEVLGNYLFGHIGDDYESMKATLDLSLELATRGWNAYAVMPLPGSQIYKEALDKGDAMPTDYLGFSFHAYETFPMHTNHLSNKEVLKFRDDAFLTYHTNPKFLIRIKEKFGQAAVDNILQMTKIKLQRQLHDK
jgi:radical SAM superfamily enzyme YgiQ (UPF0313 family)